MNNRPTAKQDRTVAPLLNLIERRFELTLGGSIDHLKSVHQHYREKREFLLAQHGEAGALVCEDYAKAVMISEASRLMILREIMPRPKKKKRK